MQGGFALAALITCLIAVPFVVLAGVFFYMSRRNNAQAQASMTWPSVLGTVAASSVGVSSSYSSESGTSTSYTPELLYEYEVLGHRYTGEKIAFTVVGYGDRRSAQTIVDRYLPGNQVRVYYNPSNPGEAVLEQSAGTGNRALVWVAVIIVVILCISIVPILLVFGGLAALFGNFNFGFTP